MKRLIIVDGNAPWVRSLFLAMPSEIDIRFLRMGSPIFFKSAKDLPWWSALRWHRMGVLASQRWIIIPGWTKAPDVSAWLTRRAIEATARLPDDDGQPIPLSETAVIFTLPQYAGVAETIEGMPRFYDAHDAFAFYAWNKEHTAALEDHLMAVCQATFAVTHKVCEDLASRTSQPVFYSPMAVSSDFVLDIRLEPPPCPVELIGLSRPIIGCTGQINETYHWKMLGELADLMPGASLVFIGPIIAESAGHRATIDSVLTGRPNVHWFGRKAHKRLPAFLHAFDVCLNPLTPGPYADRRSPLRLFDYLATDKPIVSTAIAEAAAHEGHVWIGRNAAELATVIQEAVAGQRSVSIEERRAYIDRNTWQFRALKMLEHIDLAAVGVPGTMKEGGLNAPPVAVESSFDESQPGNLAAHVSTRATKPGHTRRLIVVDGNASWVRSLFLAMPANIDVRLLRIGQPFVFKHNSDRPWIQARRWKALRPNVSERWVIIPGWNKAPAVSSWLTNRALNAAVEDPAKTTVIFTIPFYAAVAESTPLRPRVYYSYDPFEYYGWHTPQTAALESRLLNACDLTIAISGALQDDLRRRTSHPVLCSRNAVSGEFLDLMRSTTAVPNDLAAIPRPIVGTTGQINETYDWQMLGELAKLMPEVSFVAIGPIADVDPAQLAEITGVLKGHANFHWLGAKPHADLPAYINAFDVCLNPLAPGRHADRRSPLRLYDYLATDKPVISTDIAEAQSHEGHVWVGKDAVEIAALIRQGLASERTVDIASRHEYIMRNTWQARAGQFLETLDQMMPIHLPS